MGTSKRKEGGKNGRMDRPGGHIGGGEKENKSERMPLGGEGTARRERATGKSKEEHPWGASEVKPGVKTKQRKKKERKGQQTQAGKGMEQQNRGKRQWAKVEAEQNRDDALLPSQI